MKLKKKLNKIWQYIVRLIYYVQVWFISEKQSYFSIRIPITEYWNISLEKEHIIP